MKCVQAPGYTKNMDIWKHGRHLDLWSVVHILSGALLAFSCYWLNLSFWTASLISLAALILWEVIEWLLGIIEPSVNVTVDIVVGVFGFLVVAYWHYYLGNAFDVSTFSACLILTSCLALWGFLDFYFRGYR
jgi:hypothetical protein